MRDRTVQRVESWESRPFSGGFTELRALADARFSGVVVSGDAWLFMLNGRVVGVVDGDIDGFEDASGTVYEAPDPALPLLFSMQERGGQTQAKYYTNDTPLGDADKTLSEANFTGYVELSENVLSGDYYLVYYGGRALPVAFVGVSEDLKTGDDAYRLADDEVGVYEVIKTPVEVTEVPAPAEDADVSAGTAAGASEGAAATAADAPDETERTPVNAEIEDAEPAQAGAEGATEAAEAEPPTEAPEGDEVAEAEADTEADSQPGTESSTEARTDSATGPAQSTEGDASASAAGAGRRQSRSGSGPDQAAAQSSVFSEEEEWRRTRSIPSLTPSEREKRRRDAERETPDRARSKRARASNQQPESARSEGRSAGRGSRARSGSKPSEQSERSEPEPEPTDADADAPTATDAATSDAATTDTATTDTATTDTATTDTATTDTATTDTATTERVQTLEARISELDEERADLADDFGEVQAERDELERRVHELENALEDAGGEPTTGPALTPSDALAGTNLFVRYGSKGKPTLDELTDKSPDREAVNANLRIDHHTQFEADDASVDGVPFGRFLEETSAYRFVSWLVRDLPYEVLDAGHRAGLADLYDTIPEIDRAELQGVVEVETDDGTERREFDVVLRDRMGNPLVVAELNDAREPVSGDEMASLVDAAQIVGAGADHLGAAFYVTASFFEPDALENAAEATAGGGILSRSDKQSYVKLARKRGFHLCLAEDRNETFHLTVPEL